MNLIFILKRQLKKFSGYFMSLNLMKLAKVMTVFGMIAVLVSGYLWYSRLYMTNEQRFWLALENSMSTKSVTRTLISGGTGNQVVQKQQFLFTPQMASRSFVSYVQKNATQDTRVETEGISLPDANYSRYVSFRTNQTKDDGSEVNLDSVLGKWEVTEIQDSDLEEARVNYLGELVTLVIFGNFDSRFKHETIRSMKEANIYEFDANDIQERENENGKKEIAYQVRIDLKSYVQKLQDSFVKAGFGEFPPLNPENYREGSSLSAEIVIRPKTNEITGVSFGGRSEIYSSYGIATEAEKPQTDFVSGELEAIVEQEIQDVL